MDRCKYLVGMCILLVTLAGCDRDRDAGLDERGRPRLRDGWRYVEDALPTETVIPAPAPIVDQPVVNASSPLNLDCDNRAIVFAVSNFDGHGDLSSPVKQAEKQYKLFIDRGFKPDQIRVYFDKQATAAAWREAMGWLLADEKPGDVRARFQSHHGAQYRGGNESDGIDEIYFVYGSWTWDPKDFITDDEEFELASRTLQTCHHYVRIDTCYSGGMAKVIPEPGKPPIAEKKVTPPPAIAGRIATGKPKNVKLKLADLTNHTYEFACQENETSLSIGGPEPYDLFTKCRIQLDYEFPNRYVETNMRAVYALMVKDGFKQQHPTFSGDCKRVYLSPNTKVKRAPAPKPSKRSDLDDAMYGPDKSAALCVDGKCKILHPGDPEYKVERGEVIIYGKAAAFPSPSKR